MFSDSCAPQAKGKTELEVLGDAAETLIEDCPAKVRLAALQGCFFLE